MTFLDTYTRRVIFSEYTSKLKRVTVSRIINDLDNLVEPNLFSINYLPLSDLNMNSFY